MKEIGITIKSASLEVLVRAARSAAKSSFERGQFAEALSIYKALIDLTGKLIGTCDDHEEEMTAKLATFCTNAAACLIKISSMHENQHKSKSYYGAALEYCDKGLFALGLQEESDVDHIERVGVKGIVTKLFYRRGTCREKLGDADGAWADYERCLGLEPESKLFRHLVEEFKSPFTRISVSHEARQKYVSERN